MPARQAFTSPQHPYTFKLMMEIVFPTTAGELGRALHADLIGNGELPISGVSALDSAQAGSLTFFSEKKYESLLEKLEGVTILTTRDLANQMNANAVLVVENPKKAFSEITKRFLPPSPWKEISSQANIHPGASIAKDCAIAPFAVIGEGAKIGARTVVYSGAYVGPGVIIGEDCEIHPNVALIANVEIGNRVKIFSGSVLGSEGFGFLEGGGSYTAIPQIGKVVIEDDVRIGAKCTIDRSTFGETRIGKGSKLDDQVHIGHNCRIGSNCILCAQVGLAGSTILEDDVILGGQVGLGGHMTVGKGAQLGGQTGAGTNLKGGERYLGSPAAPLRETLRSFRYTLKLPELFDKVKKLEAKINKMETP